MMLNLSEQLLDPAEVPRRLPPGRNGRPVHVGTVWRWMHRGVRGGIKLESAVVGGRRVTSLEALQRFVDRLNGHAAQSGAGRSAGHREAEAELDRILG